MYAAIRATEYHLPSRLLNNRELVEASPHWTAEQVRVKTGIENRHLAANDEYASDMAVLAARKLFSSGVCEPIDVDFVILCTQSPDYLLPSTACLVQDRLGIPTSAGALDVNLGCSGFVYALSLAKGLIETGQSRNVLLLTCDTYSKYMDPGDFGVRAVFGDAATATFVQLQAARPAEGRDWIGPFVYGTDGSGAPNLIVRRGGTRHPISSLQNLECNSPSQENRDPLALFMDGPEIFSFTLKAVPNAVHSLLQKARIKLNDVDLFVFHQANQFMLEHLRSKIQIPSEKFVYELRDCGNTTSSSIPIAIRRAHLEGRIQPGNLLMLVGFGVGYSWSAALTRWLDNVGSTCNTRA